MRHVGVGENYRMVPGGGQLSEMGTEIIRFRDSTRSSALGTCRHPVLCHLFFFDAGRRFDAAVKDSSTLGYGCFDAAVKRTAHWDMDAVQGQA